MAAQLPIEDDLGPKIICRLNHFKYFLLKMEPCISALVYIYRWFYEWTNSPEELASQLEEFSIHAINLSGKKSGKRKLREFFNSQDIRKLKYMEVNKCKLIRFDIAFYCKLIQYGTNSTKLAPPTDDIWTIKCSPNSETELEHILFLINGRHGHTFNELRGSGIDTVCNTLDQQLRAVIIQAGLRTGVNPSSVKTICADLSQKIEDIRNLTFISEFNRAKVLKCIKERDIKFNYREDIQVSFNEKFRSFCPSNFILENDGREFSIKELLSISDSQVIVVYGEPGYGKTVLTKFMYHQWLRRATESINGLCSFDLVFSVSCRNITCKNVFCFLEIELCNARQNMPTGTSLKTLVEDYTTLWILDGYDESTSVFRTFLSSLLHNLNEESRIILTTRPDYFDEIDNIEGIISLTKVTMKHW